MAFNGQKALKKAFSDKNSIYAILLVHSNYYYFLKKYDINFKLVCFKVILDYNNYLFKIV